MIDANVKPPKAGFAKRLSRRAQTAALAHGENLVRARVQDPWRWRLPRLLWPHFTRD